MADTVSKAQRSKNMALIRATGNKSTEIALISLLRASKTTGWRRGSKLPGRPDFIFSKQRLAVFADGCFWHGCPQHSRTPRSNIDYWAKKINRNVERDREVIRAMRKAGWKVVRIWEHQIRKNPEAAIKKLTKALNSK